MNGCFSWSAGQGIVENKKEKNKSRLKHWNITIIIIIIVEQS